MKRHESLKITHIQRQSEAFASLCKYISKRLQLFKQTFCLVQKPFGNLLLYVIYKISGTAF